MFVSVVTRLFSRLVACAALPRFEPTAPLTLHDEVQILEMRARDEAQAAFDAACKARALAQFHFRSADDQEVRGDRHIRLAERLAALAE